MSESVFNLETNEKPKPKFTIKETPKETPIESPAAKPEPKVELKKEVKKETNPEELLKQGTQVEIRRRINIIGGEVWGEISSGYIILSSKDGVYAK